MSNPQDYILFSTDINKSTIEKSGTKAYNLFKYKLLTPEYIVLTSDFYLVWLNAENSNFNEDLVYSAIEKYFIDKEITQIIIRSSAVNERFDERGQYLSEVCKPKFENIRTAIINIFDDFSQKNNSANTMALILQKYYKPVIQGHLSNERRETYKKGNWLIEKEIISEKKIFVEKIKISIIDLLEFDYSIYTCLNTDTLNKSLQFIASWFSKIDNRFHIEWLWDGAVFWILQIDEEFNFSKGSGPGSEWNKLKWNKSFVTHEEPIEYEVFETIGTVRKNWPKISCVKKIRELKLPFWQVYILENEEIIENLASGKVDLPLRSDLIKLLLSPIVIRTDVIEYQELLLPRTDAIFVIDDAIKFLIEESQKFKRLGLTAGQFCFLIHEFIVSVSGVLAYAKPNLDRVRIDATWGIVEGLYFYPHDSFEVDLQKKKITKKLRCKYKYVDVDKDGNWYSKDAGINYDWKQSISDLQIYKIGLYTRSLVDNLEKPATIMFFVNNKKGYPEILPWFYSIDEIVDTTTDYTDVIFSEKKVTIKSKYDFGNYKNSDITQHKKNRIKLCLNVDLLRDKDFIEEIGAFAKVNNCVVDIEGSILSHPYYVLKSLGVIVRCLNPLELSYNPREFYKLVRDKIPVKIESQFESAISIKVLPNELLQLLKEKAIEEAFEFYWSKNNDNTIEELADLFEVIIGACKTFGISLAEIEKIADNKRQKRGGFEHGVFLVATKENSLFQLAKHEQKLFPDDKDYKDFKIKIKPTVKFFQKGKIKNLKSLTEIDKFQLFYINNYNSLSNNFRYLLKPGDYNSILIDYREKEICISLEKIDFETEIDQMKLFNE